MKRMLLILGIVAVVAAVIFVTAPRPAIEADTATGTKNVTIYSGYADGVTTRFIFGNDLTSTAELRIGDMLSLSRKGDGGRVRVEARGDWEPDALYFVEWLQEKMNVCQKCNRESVQ